MKSLLNTAAVVTAAIALGGCPNKRREPVPGPQSAAAHGMPTSSDGRDDASATPAPTAIAATIPAVGPVAQRLVQGTHRHGAFARKRAKWTG